MSDEKSAERRASRNRGVFERPKGSGIWWARYCDQFGRLHREKVGPKGLAREVYRARKTEVRKATFFPEQIRTRPILLAEVIDDYLARVKWKMRAYVDYERYGRYCKAAFAGKTLHQILPGDVERYQAQRRKDASPATVNRELKFLKRVFNVAIADSKISTNPVNAVTLFRETTSAFVFSRVPGRDSVARADCTRALAHRRVRRGGASQSSFTSGGRTWISQWGSSPSRGPRADAFDACP